MVDGYMAWHLTKCFAQILHVFDTVWCFLSHFKTFAARKLPPLEKTELNFSAHRESNPLRDFVPLLQNRDNMEQLMGQLGTIDTHNSYTSSI